MAQTGLRGATVRRGGSVALREVTLLAEEGELLAVLGSSGSGKTTLLRCIAGLEQPEPGEVLIRGRVATGLAPAQRRVGMVFEATHLIPFLDVAENLGWGLRVRRVPRAQAQERVLDRARRLGLSRLLRRRASHLSVGEAGVVGVGRALVATPEVFLLDEPLAHLDAAQRARVRRQIVDVVRSSGVTAFYVTHEGPEAMAVADRIALLHEGRLVQLGRPRELYDRPVNVLAAGSLGSPPMGFLPARLVSAQGMAGFEVGGSTLPLWAPLPPALRESVGAQVVLGIRARDVHPVQAGSEDPDRVVLAATVTGYEDTGGHRLVSADVHGSSLAACGEPVLAAMPWGATLLAVLPPRSPLRQGCAVRVGVDASRAHVFDAATGVALWHPDPEARGD